MAHAENEIVINRSAADVYEYLADGLNDTHWREGVKSIALRSGTPGEKGAVYSQTLSGPGGRDIAGDYEITEAVPGRELRFQVTAGPARPTGVYTLTAEEKGTRVRFSLDLAPKGLMRLAAPMITRTMRSEVAQLDRLKTELEGNAQA